MKNKIKPKTASYIPLYWGEHGDDLPKYELFYGHDRIGNCLDSWEQYAGNKFLHEEYDRVEYIYCRTTEKNTFLYKTKKPNTFPVTVIYWRGRE